MRNAEKKEKIFPFNFYLYDNVSTKVISNIQKVIYLAMQVIMINSYWKKITWKIFMQIACACTTPGLRYQWSVIYFKTHRKNTIKCISSTIKSSYHAGYISGNSNPRYVLSRNTETRKKINSRTRETHGEFSVKWRSYDHIKANSYNWQ